MAYGNQRVRTEELSIQYKAVQDRLRNDRQIVGTVFKPSTGLGRLLRLSAPLGQSYGLVLTQALHLYTEIKANDVLKNQLAMYSFTDETLDERLEAAHALAAAMRMQKIQKGEARLITGQLSEAMEELDEWMTDFIGIARQVFRKEPGQLTKLGIYVRTSKGAAEEEVPPEGSSSEEAPSSEEGTEGDASSEVTS